jgi:nitrogen fixation-related uncharacterized protein
MFGIDDPFIWLPYVLMVACVVFSVWYGIKNWQVDDKADKSESSSTRGQTPKDIKVANSAAHDDEEKGGNQ